MFRYTLAGILLLLSAFLAHAAVGPCVLPNGNDSDPGARDRPFVSLDLDWRFHLGDVTTDVANAGSAAVTDAAWPSSVAKAPPAT